MPKSLRDFDVMALDGKKIKRAAKRLKVARGYSGTPLGGKILAALDLRRGLIVAMNAHLDGETNDAPLLPGLLPQVRLRTQRRRSYSCAANSSGLVSLRIARMFARSSKERCGKSSLASLRVSTSHSFPVTYSFIGFGRWSNASE